MTAIRKALDQFVETDIDDEVIIMRRDTGKLVTLPGTAAAIWRLIDGKRDRNAVIGALADELRWRGDLGTDPLASASRQRLANTFVPRSRSWRTKALHSRSSSSRLSTSDFGKNAMCSDMQYTHRKSQRSVTDTRR